LRLGRFMTGFFYSASRILLQIIGAGHTLSLGFHTGAFALQGGTFRDGAFAFFLGLTFCAFAFSLLRRRFCVGAPALLAFLRLYFRPPGFHPSFLSRL
jgi:hypothetical protein